MNSGLDDPRQIERVLERGEQKLKELQHPDPYIGERACFSMFIL